MVNAGVVLPDVVRFFGQNVNGKECDVDVQDAEGRVDNCVRLPADMATMPRRSCRDDLLIGSIGALGNFILQGLFAVRVRSLRQG